MPHPDRFPYRRRPAGCPAVSCRRAWRAGALALTLLALTVSAASALPPLPSSFYGSVRTGSGNAPLGTSVSAWIGGVEYAQSAIFLYEGESVYALDVPGDDISTPVLCEGGTPGDAITFHIGGQLATPGAVWQSGTNRRLDLRLRAFQLFLPVVSRDR